MRTFLLLFVFIFTTASAQTVNPDYQSFRQNLLKDYQGFRNSILDDYAKYLEGVWNEFQVFRGEKRDEAPKPIVAPIAEEIPSAPVSLPEPVATPKKEPVVPPKTKPTIPVLPPSPAAIPTLEVNFYGTILKIAMLNTYKVSSFESADIASVWKKYHNDNPQKVISSLQTAASAYGLNEWFTFELVRRYVSTTLKGGSISDRIVLQHVLLTHMGYDVRLAKTNRQMLLLVPFKQIMYERSFLTIDGVKYYIFLDDVSPIDETSMGIYTCDLPDNIDKGKHIDLVFKQYAMSIKNGQSKERSLSDGKLQVTCTVDTGMMEMLRHYPQMDIPHYAESNVLPPLHKSIIDQLRPQISGMSQKQAANALLHFVQYAFDYATDGAQHGYEKPYFIEENFYYPKNDCEDRSIFYAFLVHNLLGLDVHLVQYPGHECTAVNFTDSSIRGDAYTYNGKEFIICDPTYIGATVGDCMPAYKHVRPKLELWY